MSCPVIDFAYLADKFINEIFWLDSISLIAPALPNLCTRQDEEEEDEEDEEEEVPVVGLLVPPPPPPVQIIREVPPTPPPIPVAVGVTVPRPPPPPKGGGKGGFEQRLFDVISSAIRGNPY